MRKLDEIIFTIPELNRIDIDRWISEILIEAQQDNSITVLADIQFARVKLICTLRYDMDVEEEILPIVLDLLDQLHTTRHDLHRLSQAVLAQIEDVKSSTLEVLSKMKCQYYCKTVKRAPISCLDDNRALILSEG